MTGNPPGEILVPQDDDTREILTEIIKLASSHPGWKQLTQEAGIVQDD